MLRRQNVKTTLEVYTKATSEEKLKTQGMFLEQLFGQERKISPKAAISEHDLENIEPLVPSLQ